MNIKRTLKRLIDDTQYVAALEKQNDLLKENLQQEKDNLQKQKEDFRKEKEQKVADEEAQYKKRSRNYLRPIADMQKWLLENYECRYNVITDVFEYQHHRHRGAGGWHLCARSLRRATHQVEVRPTLSSYPLLHQSGERNLGRKG